jgi:hypothetical protein
VSGPRPRPQVHGRRRHATASIQPSTMSTTTNALDVDQVVAGVSRADRHHGQRGLSGAGLCTLHFVQPPAHENVHPQRKRAPHHGLWKISLKPQEATVTAPASARSLRRADAAVEVVYEEEEDGAVLAIMRCVLEYPKSALPAFTRL